MIHTFHGHVLDGYFSPPAQRCFLEVERYLAKHTDVLVAVSPEIRDSLLEMGIGRPEQYRVVRLGLELDQFLCVTRPDGRLRTQLGVSAATPLIGVLGRLVPVKNHELLFDALRLLPGAHLVVIGDGELRSNLELLARRLEIMDRVHFTGWVTAVAEALSDVDVVVLTSTNEGTPVALIEALAASKPIVATDVGGVRSVLRHGENGLLVGSPQPSRVAQSIKQLLDSPQLRNQFGKAGREYVRTRFSSERLIAEVRSVYRSMLMSPVRRKV
jgi:glycosyltransferase involved in cell wall biosynthesis